MPFSNATIRILLASLFLASLPSTPAIAQEADPISVGNDLIEQLRTELNKKLNQTVKVKFEGVPLRQAVTHIADQIQTDVIFADTWIEEEGLTTEKPVTCALEHTQLPARKALEVTLRSTNLEAVNWDGLLLITPTTYAEEMYYIHVYHVRAIIEDSVAMFKVRDNRDADCPQDNGGATGGGLGGLPRWGLSDCLARFGGPRQMATAALIRAIQLDVTGNWYNIDGAGGQIREFDGRLVIMQTAENHAQIQKILDELRSNNNARGHNKQTKKDKEQPRPPVASPLPTY